MNILKRLTIKDLKLNKKRTIGTLIGIILAITLITVVGGMFFSMRKTLIESEIQSNGYYHVQLSDISESAVNNADIITANSRDKIIKIFLILKQCMI